jgi:hypothetical protein
MRSSVEKVNAMPKGSLKWRYWTPLRITVLVVAVVCLVAAAWRLWFMGQ